MLTAPVTLSALNFQALNGNDITALDASLGADDDICQGVMDVTTNAAVVIESTGAALASLTLRQATATTFNVGDVVAVSHLAVGTTIRNFDLYTVQSILVNTAETATKTYTSLTFDRAINIPDAVTDDDDLELRIVASAQNPTSRCSQLAKEVNVYSFALKPEEHQPSGTCNFSRIDTGYLEFSASATVQNIYALNYNVLRIMSGMGGLAYSN